MQDRYRTRRGSLQSGFTLIELTVALVIIGLIIGAVTVGTDIQRSAEHMQIKKAFIDRWENVYNLY